MSKVLVHVMYPASEKFDWTYYVEKHMALVGEKFDLIEWWVEKGTEATVSSTYQAIATLVFDSIEKWNTSFAKVGQELLADIPNYTDVMPIVQVAEVVETGKKT